MTEHLNNEQWSASTSPTAAGSIDPVLQARLDRLAQRNAAPPFAAAAGQTQAAGRSTTSPSPRADGRTPAAKPGRRHAAKGSRKAALVISLGATGALSGMFAMMDGGISTASVGNITTNSTAATGVANRTVATAVPAAAPTATTANAASVTTAAATTADTAARTATTAAATTADTTAKATTATTVVAKSTTTALGNGTYTGSSIPTKWGPVQVAITVASGKITDVKAVDVPMDRGKSIQINNAATPILRTEALTAQSSSIANVSGATYTSDGYAKSLQSAIDQARSGTTQAA
jgi:uncharacterized protein with FMN-binding domain